MGNEFYDVPLPQEANGELDRLLLPTSDFIEDWIEEVAETANRTITPTGFDRLDEALDGGLWEGLYAVGAVSSLGKTTYLLQVADQIAKQGRDVLIISLEMSKGELIAKSVSRLTFIQDSHRAYTVRELMNAKTWALAEANTKKAILEYQETAKNLYILEGNHRTNTAHIDDIVERFYRAYNTHPVIIIDYLQILALTDEKGKDPRTSVDNVVWDLKMLSRRYKIPVIVVSSFSRAFYDKPAEMGSFKESGGIEYTSDVVLGLQLRGVGTEGFNLEDAKGKTPREVELVILKNRNGRTGDKISYYYHSAYNYYKEMKREDETQEKNTQRNTFTPKQAKITRR
jgi:replicative DNA helicase